MCLSPKEPTVFTQWAVCRVTHTWMESGLPVWMAMRSLRPQKIAGPVPPANDCLVHSGWSKSSAGQDSSSRRCCTFRAQAMASIGSWKAMVKASPSVATCSAHRAGSTLLSSVRRDLAHAMHGERLASHEQQWAVLLLQQLGKGWYRVVKSQRDCIKGSTFVCILAQMQGLSAVHQRCRLELLVSSRGTLFHSALRAHAQTQTQTHTHRSNVAAKCWTSD